jgi:hypothetical protein
MGWMIGVLGCDSRRGLGIFLITASRPALGPTQSPIQWVPGALSVGIKWPGREADPRSKNEWSYTSTPQYAFMVRCSLKAQGQLFYFISYDAVAPNTKSVLHYVFCLQALLVTGTCRQITLCLCHTVHCGKLDEFDATIHMLSSFCVSVLNN